MFLCRLLYAEAAYRDGFATIWRLASMSRFSVTLFSATTHAIQPWYFTGCLILSYYSMYTVFMAVYHLLPVHRILSYYAHSGHIENFRHSFLSNHIQYSYDILQDVWSYHTTACILFSWPFIIYFLFTEYLAIIYAHSGHIEHYCLRHNETQATYAFPRRLHLVVD